MTPAQLDLLQRLQTLHGKLVQGDGAARAFVEQLKAEAKAGSRKASLTYNTLAAIHWGKVPGGSHSPVTWEKAEAFYARLLADEPKAWRRLREIRSGVAKGEPRCRQAFSMLKAVHKHKKESVWYPGAPQIGYFPMPSEHRPGIVFGAHGGLDLPHGRPDDPGSQGHHYAYGHGQHPPQGSGHGQPHPHPQGRRRGRPSTAGYAIVGFDIPGLGSIPTPGGAIPNQLPGGLGNLGNFIPGGMPEIPGVPGLSPHGPSPIPGLPGGLGVPGGIPGGGALGDLGNLLNQIVPGMLPGDQGLVTVPGQTVPLSTEASQQILGLVAVARQALPPEQRVLGGGTASNPNLSPFTAQKMEDAARRLEVAPLKVVVSTVPGGSYTQEKAAEAKRSAQLMSSISTQLRAFR